MIWNALQRWREERFLRRCPLDRSAWEQVVRAWPAQARYQGRERERLFDLVQRFLFRKQFLSGGGFPVGDRERWLVATMACVPVLALGLEAYRGFQDLILYETPFIPARDEPDELGLVNPDPEPLSGEAWSDGPVILSWEDVCASDGDVPYNVVIHEMAHKLDMLNGDANGAPPMPRAEREHWYQVFQGAWEDLGARLEAGEDSWIDPYALEHPAEFFAVICEAFFETPDALEQEWPPLYRVLVRFFRQDPARGRLLEAA